MAASPPPSVTGDATIRIGDDTMSGTLSGTGAVPDASGIVPFQGVLTIQSGTGRFSNASGTLSFTGSANLNNNTGVFLFRGGILNAGI